MEQDSTMTQSSENQSPINHAIRFGAIIGGVSIVLTLLLYAIDYSLMVNWKIGLLMIAIFIGLVIYGGITYRNQSGGYLSYGKAFQHSYVSLLVGGFIGSLFSIILYTVIDPELPQKLTDVSLQNTEQMFVGFGMSEDQIEEQLDKLREELPNKFTAVGVLKQYGWGFLVNAVIASITAIFVKRKEPEMM